MKTYSDKQKICLGVYYTITPARGLNFKMNMVIKWYGFPLLAWKTAHEDYDIKWYQYPQLILIIAKHSILRVLGVR